MIGRRMSMFLGFVLVTFCRVQSGLMSCAKGVFKKVVWREENMKLQIVWRNPHPPVLTKLLVKQIVADAYGALYEVRSRHQLKVFELISPRAA